MHLGLQEAVQRLKLKLKSGPYITNHVRYKQDEHNVTHFHNSPPPQKKLLVFHYVKYVAYSEHPYCG
jgi:hypothetical protein